MNAEYQGSLPRRRTMPQKVKDPERSLGDKVKSSPKSQHVHSSSSKESHDIARLAFSDDPSGP